MAPTKQRAPFGFNQKLPLPMKNAPRNNALDQLRGLAAIFMIVNHFGYIALKNDLSNPISIEIVLFFTGLAPVLFFYTTGYGMGLQKINSKMHSTAIWGKIFLLIVADFFIRNPSMPNVVGVDFFGFIAILIFFIHVISFSRYFVWLAIFLIGMVLLQRYAPIGWLNADYMHSDILNFITGRKGVENISYPISPWLIFPLTGFLLAVTSFINKRGNIFFLLGIGLLFLTIGLQAGDFVFFRWGTMSFAYFSLSLCTLFLMHYFLAKNDIKFFDSIKLNGIESFLVVPIHYFIVRLIGHYIPIDNSEVLFFIFATIICFLVIVSTKNISKIFNKHEIKINFGIYIFIFFTAGLSINYSNSFVLNQMFILFALIVCCYKFQFSKKYHAYV